MEGLREGDLVIPGYVGECEECENCTSGKTNLCLKFALTFSGLMPDGSSRMSVRGQKLYHVLSCSTWSEYMVVDANLVSKIDPTLNLAHASFLSCGFSTGFGSAWKVAEVEKGSTVAVLGLGAVGLGVWIHKLLPSILVLMKLINSFFIYIFGVRLIAGRRSSSDSRGDQNHRGGYKCKKGRKGKSFWDDRFYKS